MNSPLMKSIIVVALRHVWPVLGFTGVVQDSELEQIAGALILIGSIAYHVYQRHQGKKALGEA